MPVGVVHRRATTLSEGVVFGVELSDARRSAGTSEAVEV
jgi:hypothetical protein